MDPDAIDDLVNDLDTGNVDAEPEESRSVSIFEEEIESESRKRKREEAEDEDLPPKKKSMYHIVDAEADVTDDSGGESEEDVLENEDGEVNLPGFVVVNSPYFFFPQKLRIFL